MTEGEAYIALNLISDIGPIRVRNLIDVLGSPEQILSAEAEDLEQAKGIGWELAKKLSRQAKEVDPAGELEKAEKLGVRILTPVDDDYPAPLLDIYDPPLALYIKGELKKEDKHAIAMVGSRRSTHYGRQTADRLAFQLARAGMTVVSGLARGIDTAAHQGALKSGGRTIAVLGGAMDCLYPAENESLAEEIAESGVVMSEYPLGREPDKTTFPYRNRVVSGLSLGVLVVEAPPRSGSLITADVALEQGRTVFAVPGRIDTPSARGTNRLIKNGARLVEDVEDVLQEFEYLIPAVETASGEVQAEFPELLLSEAEQNIVEKLVEGETDVDTLARRTELDMARVSALLLGLEMKRVIKMLPGRMVALATPVPRKKE